MSENESHHHGKGEIIIIKRHGGHGGGHHGGAWKIAYADFMTAMMAFFLVMWLVNAANSETKAAVASYFNPIKMTDAKPAKRGHSKANKDAEGEQQSDQAKEVGDSPSTGEGGEAGKEKNASAGDKAAYSDANYFDNPYAVLSEIVMEVGQEANVSEKAEGGKASAGPAKGADGGQAYRDPFDPDFWTRQMQVSKMDQVQNDNTAFKTTQDPENQPQDQEAENVQPQQDVAMLDPKPADPADQAIEPGQPQKQATGDAQSGDVKAGEQKAGEQKAGENSPTEVLSGLEQPEPADPAKTEQAAVTPKPEQLPPDDAKSQEIQKQADLQKQADALNAEIAKAVGKGAIGKLAEGLTVVPAEGGLLISVTDQFDTSMFNVGSAVPKRDMVLLMEKIGKILEERPGQIAIRGHTDARPFKSKVGDNWALSMDRAHSAYFMLVRGGLKEDRVTQVTGFADRRLKVQDNPLADSNRRIEILIEAKDNQG
jgi:chemotaxis protein MotB